MRRQERFNKTYLGNMMVHIRSNLTILELGQVGVSLVVLDTEAKLLTNTWDALFFEEGDEALYFLIHIHLNNTIHNSKLL